ncbi:MAG: T9SS type A sorting domain-containing protein [Bacteroidales bacterium]|nr:T9SS type A sorting domain-containing protein [Bacteroidales bacterium]
MEHPVNMKIIACFIMTGLFCSLPFIGARAQIPVGKWRAHLSYDSIQDVTGSKERIFAAAQSGILVYNKNYNSTETIDKVKGLSEAGISSLGYSKNHQALLIGYQSGNLDVLKDGDVTNHPYIKDHAYYTEGKIAGITFRQGKALLSCPFGIAVFDMDRKEFLETYQPGKNQVSKVHDVAYDDKNYYAATESGLFYADINTPDLYDPESWEQVTAFPNYNRRVKEVEVFNGYTLINVQKEGDKSEIYYMNDLNNSVLLLEGKVETLKSSTDKFYIGLSNAIRIYASDLSFVDEITEYASLRSRPNSIYPVSGGNVWIGDSRAGLIRLSGNAAESIVPDGPATDHAFAMVSEGNRIFSVPGGYDDQFNPKNRNGAVQQFSGQEWNNRLFSQWKDFVDIVTAPESKEDLLIGSWGDGILEIREGKIKNQFVENNSSLEAYNDGGVYVQDMAWDEEGNLWVLNYGSAHPFKFMEANGNWKVFEYEPLQDKVPMGLLSAKNGYKWGFLNDSPYLFVIDDRNTPSQSENHRVKITEVRDNNGKSYASRIYAIQEDREGNIWFATDEGIGVDYDPQSIFEEDTYQPNRPRISEEGYTHFMLRDNIVTDIAVDPANQIWFATQTSGVFAYNPKAQEMVHHFTASSSPLLTDTLQSIAVNETGEVFMGTSRGMISYRSHTSEGQDTFEDTYAFPNPVPPDYQGTITITNLVENVNVKITDISGNLVYETIAKGGQATWSGKDFSDRPVGSGVYLIFLTNKDGSKTHVEKLLFIR